MFKCTACGELFETPKMISESRGEFWGIPCCEDVPVSPCCDDDFVEVKEYHAEGKVYALIDDEMHQVADFEGEYTVENEDELYDEVLAEQMSKWCSKFGDDLDVDIEVYWEA